MRFTHCRRFVTANDENCLFRKTVKNYFFSVKLHSSQFLNLDYVHTALEVLDTLLSLQKPGLNFLVSLQTGNKLFVGWQQSTGHTLPRGNRHLAAQDSGY